ncbi:MAG: hypothetical protein MJ149_00010 [Clostridia bacterium]|nr:hypothetical protein [Clostridia bacterium]
MEEMLFFDNAKERVTTFFEQEFPNFPPLLMSHFLNNFNDFLNYNEEGISIKPKIVFTDNIEVLSKSLNKIHILTLFEDEEPTMFKLRLKTILAIARPDWCLFIDIKPNKISYGLIMSFRSIKDRNLIQTIEEIASLKERDDIHCLLVRPLNFYTMSLKSISGNAAFINFSLDKTKDNTYSTEIKEFIDTIFSKLRTTQRKLQDMKNMYQNIFTNVVNDVNGSICVVVDKDYKDNGMFEDGVWLKEPISFSKLFTQSKSYSETKLQAHCDLLVKMLNFDGITIIDNQGRLRAYNVFVEPNNKRVGYIVGGARKRAAYYILSSKKKGIVGVYFQSHEGEIFFQQLKSNNKTKKLAPKAPAAEDANK